MSWWRRLKDVIVHKILGLDDAPRRIAWGVFLGFFVAMTPTLGLQILIYVTCATLFRVNKVSGIPILFISNPFTAVPIYGFCWWVGNALLHGSVDSGGWEEVQARLFSDQPASEGLSTHLLSVEFWSRVGGAMVELGGEMWLGSCVLGLAMAIPAYFVTLWGVSRYRMHRDAQDADESRFSGPNERLDSDENEYRERR